MSYRSRGPVAEPVGEFGLLDVLEYARRVEEARRLDGLEAERVIADLEQRVADLEAAP